MLEKRLYKPSELTALGIGRESLRVWRDDPAFPKPVRGKFYDIKAIQLFLDKLSGLKPESLEPDYDQIIKERLKNGNRKSEVPANA